MRTLESLLGTLKRHAWLTVFAVTIGLLIFPVGYWASRVCLVASSATLWIWGVCLLRRHRLLAFAILVTGSTLIIWMCLPGRLGDPAVLRRSYILCLKQYEGTRYVWGGENRLGIDCSGLVRRGLINANIKTGLLTLNPRLFRTAVSLWWNDCTARALRDEYRAFTARIALAETINDIPLLYLIPGDLAITSDGAHVLAYLGETKWIEADPNVMEVITVTTPSDKMWFKTPVQIVRWSQLQEKPEFNPLKRAPRGVLNGPSGKPEPLTAEEKAHFEQSARSWIKRLWTNDYSGCTAKFNTG